MAFGIELIRVPEALIPASFKRTKIDKTAGKASTDERNTAMNSSMRPDQKMMSCLYKMQASLEKSHEMVKDILKPAPAKPTRVASPRVNDVVSRLQAQLAELNKKVEMLVSNQPERVFDGAFSHGPREIPVEKSVESSVFNGAFSPRDVTPIIKEAEKSGFWPLSIKHAGPGSAVIKSSTLCPWDHEEVKAPLSKTAGPDTSIFDNAFARA